MSWLYSRALVEEYSEGICSDGEPSALWNGKPTQQASWLPAKTTKHSQLSQSGMTFKPLTEEHGEAVLMSFLEAFPVRTSPVQEKARASRENDHPCGNTWRESLEKFDLDTHTWKTHQCLWDEDLQPSSVILPKWGMMRSGVLWERTTLPRLTSGTGSGFWRTPECAKGGTVSDEVLNEMAEGNWKRESGHLRQLRLQDQVRHTSLWPTPTVQDSNKATKKWREDYQNNLTAAAFNPDKMYPTPTTRDHKGGYTTESLIRKDGKSRATDALPNAVIGGKGVETVSGQLNPTWVEWLMGWPIGWTSMEAITDLDWRDWSVDPADEGDTPRVATGIKHRIGRLKAIGNGQVPQVAAMAWEILNK